MPPSLDRLEGLVEGVVADHMVTVTDDVLANAVRDTVGKDYAARVRTLRQNIQFGLVSRDDGLKALELMLQRTYGSARSWGWLRGYDMHASHILLHLGSKTHKLASAKVAAILLEHCYPLPNAKSLFAAVLVKAREETLRAIAAHGTVTKLDSSRTKFLLNSCYELMHLVRAACAVLLGGT